MQIPSKTKQRVMNQNTSVIWTWLFAASIAGLAGVLTLAAFYMWAR